MLEGRLSVTSLAREAPPVSGVEAGAAVQRAGILLRNHSDARSTMLMPKPRAQTTEDCNLLRRSVEVTWQLSARYTPGQIPVEQGQAPCACSGQGRCGTRIGQYPCPLRAGKVQLVTLSGLAAKFAAGARLR